MYACLTKSLFSHGLRLFIHKSLPNHSQNIDLLANMRDSYAAGEDPLTGYPQAFGVLWSHGRIHNLDTLGGNQSFAVAINNRGQDSGIAENDVPDPFSLCGPGGTLARWKADHLLP